MSWPGLRFAGIARTLPQSGGSLKWRLARELSSVCDSLCGRVGLGLAGPFLNLTPEDSEYLRGGALQWVGPHTLKARPLGLQDPLYREGVASGGEGEPSGLSAEELQEAGLAVGLAGALLEGALGERAQAEGACEVIRVEAAAQGRHAAAGNREATRGAQRAAPCVEVVLAQRAALVLEKAASREGREAFPADETVRVPERAKRRDVVIQDGALAALAARGEQLQEVPAAVGAALALVKTLISKGLPATDAAEMLWVPVSAQGGHHFVSDGLVAEATSWREALKVALGAEGGSILLEEAAASQGGGTASANEVLGVPGAAQSRHHLPSNRFIAGATEALGLSGNTPAAEVGLQQPQHGV